VTAMPFGAGSLVGSPVRRVEDPLLLRGRASYVDNLDIDGILSLVFVRSSFAHAELRGVDIAAAASMRGVVAVHTANDLQLPDFPGFIQLHPKISRPPLAKNRVRFVGDAVAAVLAETRTCAVDAAERVEVVYERLPDVIDPEDALAANAPLLFDELGTNLFIGARSGTAIDPIAGADLVVRGRFENQRVAVVPMETSAIAAIPGDDGDGHELTVYLACQLPHMMQALVGQYLEVDPAKIRLVAPDVGGSFGGKHLSVEGIVAIKLAMLYQRPVKWVEARSESMIALPHGRGQVQYAEMGFRRDGKIVGAHFRIVGDGGAYAGIGGMLSNTATRTMAQGVYHIPKIDYDVAVAVTNTTPMGAYRGAGRPEAAALLERTIDMAADELGIDPAELRRRNLISSDEFPFRTVTGAVYDSGDYEAALDRALQLAGYQSLLNEQAERRRRGDKLQLGIGISLYVEITGGPSLEEYAQVEIHDDGSATVKAGTSAHGQGHATTFSSIAADTLGIPIERIRYVQSDTAAVARGSGTGGSRSVQLAGTAVLEASERVLEVAKVIAADMLEAASDDIVVVTGDGLGVAGVPSRALAWDQIAAEASQRGVRLAVDHDAKQGGPSFPFGAHVSVVEVDMETGRVKPLRHIAVDDCGRIINPMLVKGQVHGGLASGIAQALWEEFVYDADGNPLTSTLADYAMPSAAELISFETAHTVTPSPLNALGAKGVGESATVGSTPAVQNAVVDALSHLGVRHLDMPCTPERVWRAIEAARAGTLPSPWREPPAVFATLPVREDDIEGPDFNI
jgi:carbon-monoxide dehydrogenase large subunit